MQAGGVAGRVAAVPGCAVVRAGSRVRVLSGCGRAVRSPRRRACAPSTTRTPPCCSPTRSGSPTGTGPAPRTSSRRRWSAPGGNLDRVEQDGRPVRPWLFTVAQHIAVDAHRARRARPPEVGDAALAVLPGMDQIEATLDRIVVTDALHALSQEHRAVIVETYYRGRSVAEAARVLDIPAGTVKSRCYYALRALRLALRAGRDAVTCPVTHRPRRLRPRRPRARGTAARGGASGRLPGLRRRARRARAAAGAAGPGPPGRTWSRSPSPRRPSCTTGSSRPRTCGRARRRGTAAAGGRRAGRGARPRCRRDVVADR